VCFVIMATENAPLLRNMKNNYVIGIFLAFLLIIVGCAPKNLDSSNEKVDPIERIYNLDPQRKIIGMAISDLHFVDSIENKQIHIDEVYKDKIVMIQSFSQGCPACVQGIKEYNYLYDKFGDKIEVVYMDIDPNDKAEDVQGVKTQYNGGDWLWTHYQGSLLPFYEQFNFYANDMTIILDRQGNVAYADSFSVPTSRLENALNELV